MSYDHVVVKYIAAFKLKLNKWLQQKVLFFFKKKVDVANVAKYNKQLGWRLDLRKF